MLVCLGVVNIAHVSVKGKYYNAHPVLTLQCQTSTAVMHSHMHAIGRTMLTGYAVYPAGPGAALWASSDCAEPGEVR